MSDFLFTSSRAAPGHLAATLQRFLHGVRHDVREVHGAWGSLAWTCADHEPTFHHDDDGVITLVAGSPIVRLPGHAPRAIRDPDLRKRVHRLCADPAYNVGPALDGHFAVLTLLPDALVLTTDRSAYIPIFTADGVARGAYAAAGEADNAARGFVCGTHVDAVARAAGIAHDLDPVAIADLCLHETCTPPFTIYRGVRQMPAGARLVVRLRDSVQPGGRAQTGGHAQTGGNAKPDGHAQSTVGARIGEVVQWWAPVESSQFRTLRDAAHALREALVDSVTDAVSGARSVALLMSGGEDSRAVLGAVPRGVGVRPVIYAEWESREVRVARAAARAYGATLDVQLRASDHYASGFDATSSMVGSYHSFLDVHGNGLAEQLGLQRMDVVLGGLCSDSLLKGIYEKHAQTLRPLRGVNAHLLAAVSERRRVLRSELLALRPHSAEEWEWLWPWSLRNHGANVDGNRRMFSSWEAFHAAAVLEIAAAVPVEWKRHRRLFRAAVRPLLAPSWYVPHAEYRFPYFGRGVNAVLRPALGVARGLRGVTRGELRRRHRPWPKWHTVLRSPELQQRETELLARSPLPGLLWGDEPSPLDGWSSRQRLLFLQLMHVQALAAD